MTEKVKNTPSWALSPVLNFGDQVMRLQVACKITIRGAWSILREPQLQESVLRLCYAINGDGDFDKTSHPELDRLRTYAESAQREIDEGFPLLHEQAVIFLWSLLKHVVDNEVVAFLMNDPSILRSEQFRNLKVELGPVLDLVEDERYRYILEELEKQKHLRFTSGVKRLEGILGVAGLTGTVDPVVSSYIYELNHVRNVLVHRGGRADQRFVDACPSWGVTIGRPLKVAHEEFMQFYLATAIDGGLVRSRIYSRFGDDNTKLDQNIVAGVDYLRTMRSLRDPVVLSPRPAPRE